jgi:hypothetical protein
MQYGSFSPIGDTMAVSTRKISSKIKFYRLDSILPTENQEVLAYVKFLVHSHRSDEDSTGEIFRYVPTVYSKEKGFNIKDTVTGQALYIPNILGWTPLPDKFPDYLIEEEDE